jgi:hypothetical protein
MPYSALKINRVNSNAIHGIRGNLPIMGPLTDRAYFITVLISAVIMWVQFHKTASSDRVIWRRGGSQGGASRPYFVNCWFIYFSSATNLL